MIDYKKIEEKLDEVLRNETDGSLKNWLAEKRQKIARADGQFLFRLSNRLLNKKFSTYNEFRLKKRKLLGKYFSKSINYKFSLVDINKHYYSICNYKSITPNTEKSEFVKWVRIRGYISENIVDNDYDQAA